MRKFFSGGGGEISVDLSQKGAATQKRLGTTALEALDTHIKIRPYRGEISSKISKMWRHNGEWTQLIDPAFCKITCNSLY